MTDLGIGDWIAHPDGLASNNDELTRKLVENRDKIKVLAEWEDPTADWSYEYAAVIRLGRDYYVLTTSGCSCPSPTETWLIDYGPATKGAVNKWLQTGISTYDPRGRLASLRNQLSVKR